MWWDRFLCLALSIAIYFWGFSNQTNTKPFIRSVNFLFYIQTFFLVWAAGRNDYSTFYFMSLFLVQQSYVYCLRSNREVYFYLAYSYLLIMCSLFFVSELTPKNLGVFIFTCSLITLVQLLASIVKARFVNDMKMNQDLLRTLVSKADMAVFLADDTGIILDSNSRATELFGYEREELVGKDFKLLRKVYLSEREILDAYEEFDQNKFWNAITTLITKAGKEIHSKISVAPIMNGSKRILIYRVIDITAIKENETKLIEAKEKAEEAMKAKGQFLAMMSHEIRTPLNGVIATASMLARTDMNSQQSEYVDTVRKSGQSLLMLINDILDFSKLESGKMMLDPQPGKPEEIVFEVGDLLRPYAEEKGIALKVEMTSTNNELLLMDAPKLKQVLLNLIGNALKFTHKGTVNVCLETVGVLQDKVKMRYTVSDTGIGIPEDKMHLLFQSFSQVDSSTSRKYGGTGLGLAISQQIVEMMGGSISVESMVGEGTKFSFVISHPISTDQEVVSPTIQDEPTAEIDFSKYKVLVADDNEINRQVFSYMLNLINVDADMATNGIEVIEFCKQSEYDIIFMDMQMPEMDGIEATRIIRQDQRHQPVIIAVTANSYHDDRKRCIDAGMNDFLSKPFDNIQLTSILHRIVTAGPTYRDSAA